MIDNSQRIEIIKSELKTLYAQQYRVELQGKAHKQIENKDGVEKSAEILAKINGQIEFYEAEKSKLNKKK